MAKFKRISTLDNYLSDDSDENPYGEAYARNNLLKRQQMIAQPKDYLKLRQWWARLHNKLDVIHVQLEKREAHLILCQQRRRK